jgi:tRNA (guanine37-N1)-methyltransferase
MNITVLTLFPEMVEQVLNTSIIGRAIEAGLLKISAKNIRDHAMKAYAKVDDALFGGGTGMLMMCQPIYDSYLDVLKYHTPKVKPHTIFLTPSGTVFNQKRAVELSKMKDLIFLCGHYEGIDQRVVDELVDEEVSIGDYILTGGELPACVVIDAIARLVPGVLPNQEASELESHMGNGLEHPQYTRPFEWRGRKVPNILLSGHHEKIKKTNRLEGLYNTMVKRPDLFGQLPIEEEEMAELISYIRNKH